MRRYLYSILFIAAIIGTSGTFFFRSYWVSRYNEMIVRQARIYRLDEKLVWSLVYEESYFRPSQIGDAGEVGLMQVTPLVAREWSKETGLKELEKQATDSPVEFLSDPERNVQIGCWYLEKLRERYRGRPAETAMTLAAYNAGASRVEEWTKGSDAETMTEPDFVSRIAIPSTNNYVSSILNRYRKARELQ